LTYSRQTKYAQKTKNPQMTGELSTLMSLKFSEHFNKFTN